jgi:ABC-type uncharacterized transport system auxiliary subunit
MVNVQMPAKGKRITNKVLGVDNISMAPQYSSLGFVYRISDIHYTSDYYNVFFNPPAQQIEQSIIKYLQTKNIFKYVTTKTDIFQPDYILRANVLELYADYRNARIPKGVMTIHFTLFVPNGKTNILLDKTYRSASVLHHKDSRSLVYAWNEDLAKILVQLSNNLPKLEF